MTIYEQLIEMRQYIFSCNKSYFFPPPAAERHDASRMEEEFMSSVRDGQLSKIQEVVNTIIIILIRKVGMYEDIYMMYTFLRIIYIVH